MEKRSRLPRLRTRTRRPKWHELHTGEMAGIVTLLLKNQWVRAARRRSGESVSFPVRLRGETVRSIARYLTDLRLARVFIEAQFEAFPADVCQELYNRKYPPAEVCFGGDAI